MTIDTRRKNGLMFAGLGGGLLSGGLIAAGTIVTLLFQSGLAATWGREWWNDPVFVVFASCALVFISLAAVGGYLCLLAWKTLRSADKTDNP